MSKKTKAELVDEGKVLQAAIADIRKQVHNFALLLGSEGAHLAIHKTKSVIALKNEAKAAGGNPAKGALGTVEMEGKTLKFSCAEGEDPPGMLGRKFKTHLRERGLSFKVEIRNFKGEILEGDEEDIEPVANPSGETEPSVTTPQPASASQDPVTEDIKEKLEKALAKLMPAIKTTLATGEPALKTTVTDLLKAYKAGLATQDYAACLKALNDLKVELAPGQVTVKPVASIDTAALISKAALVDATVTRATTDNAYLKQAAPKLKDLRTVLKAAIAATPPPTGTELTALTAMKTKLDDLFLGDLKTQGHGPQRHEGDVTPQQLVNRATKGEDPMTGTTTDGVTGGTHKFNRHATRFLDAGSFVDAEETMRSSQVCKDEQKLAKAAGETRVAVKIPIETALGSDFAKMIEGKTRDGSVKNLIGSHATDFTGGTLIAIYDVQSDDSLTLVTMYPEPLPTP